MALEFGSGTQADPYLLVNLADVTAWLTTKQYQGYWFALVADLDLSGSPIEVTYSNWKWNIDGRGNRLSIYINRLTPAYSLAGNLYECEINNASITLRSNNSGFFGSSILGRMNLKDSSFEIMASFSGASKTIFGGTNGLVIELGTYGGVLAGSSNIYKHGGATANTINTAGFADKNPYNPVNYPPFTTDKWIFDGISLPRTRPKETADLTNRYCVKGQSTVGGSNRQRNLAVFTENGLRYKLQDTKADGSFFLNLNDVSTPVIVMAYDDIGAKAAINTAYSLNQIIHPAIPNGFRYRCTLAGNSGATIPPEPWSTTTVLTIGAAKFTPEPVYEAKAHGPLLPVLFNVVTEQPV
ncbi:hypothetical protein [Aeromonas veronii]|uniref:Uncharacterized protein n=1 Tax=Aeromonas veronii AMC34 TaxID=1073383 RepID=K1IG29_AERVE|nr:hypothetical protein [Aeromonas veronii]EKB17166.1 hypothetical protein HMPREF1168_03393 [Aeromonas veronii AMC34]